MKFKGEYKRLAYFLPNTFTALNMACGFTAVLLSYQGKFYFAAIAIILGSIFDLVDGRVARLVDAESAFGEQFDSISDVVTFGVAPSILIYNSFLINYNRLGAVVAFIYLLCGALRLARFNANIDKVESSFFQGLPIPSAAIAIAGYVLLATRFEIIFDWPIIAIPYTVFYALLMISNIPFNSFKDSKWMKGHRRITLMIIFVLLALVISFEHCMTIAIVNVYTLGCILYFLIHFKELKDVFKWEEDGTVRES